MFGEFPAITLHIHSVYSASEQKSLRSKSSLRFQVNVIPIPSTLRNIVSSTHNKWPTYDFRTTQMAWMRTFLCRTQFDWLKLVFRKWVSKNKFNRSWRKIKAGISINNCSRKNCLILSSIVSRICIDSIEVKLNFSFTWDIGSGKKVY